MTCLAGATRTMVEASTTDEAELCTLKQEHEKLGVLIESIPGEVSDLDFVSLQIMLEQRATLRIKAAGVIATTALALRIKADMAVSMLTAATETPEQVLGYSVFGDMVRFLRDTHGV